MKYLLLPLLLFSTAVFAQVNLGSSEHLTFKGLPIDGSLSEFVSKLKNTGLTYLGTEDGIAVFEGEFAGYPDCQVIAYALDDLVAKVGVGFPVDENWPQLSKTYERLQDLLTEKYGEPDMDVEEYTTRYTPTSGDAKMRAINDDEFEIYTSYSVENGTIQLTIVGEFYLKGRVLLIYFDASNLESLEKKIIDDL